MVDICKQLVDLWEKKVVEGERWEGRGEVGWEWILNRLVGGGGGGGMVSSKNSESARVCNSTCT